MTPLQMATMIRVYLDRIQIHAKNAERELNSINGVSFPEGRAYQDFQYSMRHLFEACDLLRFKLQDERSDLAPPTREEEIAAVMHSMRFIERATPLAPYVSLVGVLSMETSVQFMPQQWDLDQKDRMKRKLAEIIAGGLSAKELLRMVRWHRERAATADMQSEEQTQ